METNKTCLSCGKPIGPDAPQGLCPECLMKVGVGSFSVPVDGTVAQTGGFEPPSMDDLARLFPQLEVLELIGKGGMGAVYKARQKDLDRLVALKVLPAQAGVDPGFTSRFTREARALARLAHPNIVAVYEFGEAEGLHYFLMEYVDGTNLRQIERSGGLSPKQALAIIPQICEALQFAHDKGIVHRDIKPENILLDREGHVKIADFGLAKILGRNQDLTLTQEGHVMGTPHYMAPEQVEHPQAVDHRADIYSLGVVFYEMLTGELPMGKFQPPSAKVQIDVRLDEVVLRTLEKEPDRRYQQASQVKTEVETIANTASSAKSEFRIPNSEITGEEREQVRHEVKWPAIGLIISTLLSPLIPVLLIVLDEVQPAAWMVVAFALMLVLMAMAVYGGLQMLWLGSFRAAMTGGIAAMALAIFNINILGPPFAGWALFVLTRREVRQSFGRSRREEAPSDKSEIRIPKSESEQRLLSSAAPGEHLPRWVTTTRWTGRILGLLGFLFVFVFILAEGFPQFFGQPQAVQVELAATVQMLAGLLLGWRWPGWGAFLIIDGWLVFLVAERGWPPVPYTAFLIVAGLYAWSWWRERGRSRPLPLEGQAAINEAEWRDPKNWTGPRWLSLYFSKRDCRVWVPKQIPALGWTVNLGHPKGLACLLGLIVLLSLLPAITPHLFSGRDGSAFVPEKEVNLNDVDLLLGQDALDLDSGQLLDQPKEMRRWPEYKRTQWFVENGPDLFVHFAEGQFHLITPICNELKLTSLANDRWTTISARDLTQALATGTSGLTERQVKAVRQLLLPADARLPLTFGFQTASGSLGLLQIAAFIENPRGAKIRYKLVQKAKGGQELPAVEAAVKAIRVLRLHPRPPIASYPERSR